MRFRAFQFRVWPWLVVAGTSREEATSVSRFYMVLRKVVSRVTPIGVPVCLLAATHYVLRSSMQGLGFGYNSGLGLADLE